MVFVGICIVAAIALSFRSQDFSGGKSITMILYGLTGMIIGGTVSLLVTTTAPTACVTPHSVPLHNLVTAPSLYYVRSTYVNQTLTYFYLTQDKDDGFTSHSVTAGLGKVYETGGKPTVTTFTAQTNLPWRLLTIVSPEQTCSVVFKVPPGSIQNTFEVG
jgi:hypothetical protein